MIPLETKGEPSAPAEGRELRSSKDPAASAPVRTEAPIYTIGQLARAIGISWQALAKGLESAPWLARVGANREDPGGLPFASLCLEWQMQITRRALERGYADGERFLTSLPVIPWPSPLPWDRVPAKGKKKKP